MQSRIYTGVIKHDRYSPKQHRFQYSLFMMYIDLDEIEILCGLSPFISYEKCNVATFRRSDYLGSPNIDLKKSVYEVVREKTGKELNGPVRMLTHLRYFGHCMNPVTFYYCFDEKGENLQAVVSDIENTPWGERYQYVHLEESIVGDENDFREIRTFEKDFHVSPFFPMDITYQWAFSRPDENLCVSMKSLRQGEKVFHASLALNAHDVTRNHLQSALAKFPLMTIKVIVGIYIQAFFLWIKKVPFHRHPEKSSQKSFFIF